MADTPCDLLLFDIQRFSVHDGPGIRTTVFLKGCPLRCTWCQNPESLRGKPEMAFHADRCAGCMRCAQVCPKGAIRTGPKRIDWSRCDACGLCAEACPQEALRKIGWHETPEAVLDQVRRDREYFDATGGGVTLSGGEPLLQAEGAAHLLQRCRAEGIHTAVQTSGAVGWQAFERVLPHVDLVYFDLKAFPATLHEKLTAGSFDRIAQNARRVVSTGAHVVFRMPVVPGINDSLESISGLAGLLEQMGRSSLRLLPYHRGGDSKRTRLDTDQEPLDLSRSQADAALDAAVRAFSGLGIEAIPEGVRIEPTAEQKARTFGSRVWRLRQEVQQAAPAVCPERALLVTEYFRPRRNRRKPATIQRAEALRHILRKRHAAIYPDELLVGCFSSKRVGGSIFPELHGVAMLEDLFSFRRRKVNPLRISSKERLALATRVMPFWLPRFLSLRAFPRRRALRFIAEQLGGKTYLINETGGISHFVPDYPRLLALGTSGIAAEACRLGSAAPQEEKKDFYRAVEIVCQGLEELAARYARIAGEMASGESDETRRRELDQIARTCERVPRLPAETLQEAFQSILFAQIALNMESLDNSVSPGRLDQVLYPYYRTDIDAGRIDTQQARDLVGCYTVKMSEIIPVFSRRITRFHGGMFNGQVVVVGGQDARGKDATNELTWLFLDAMDQLRMRQPNYHARIHGGSPEGYLERIAAMLRDGSVAPALMNDDVVVPMLMSRGMTREDALDYSPVGCVEPVACCKTFGSTDAALTNLAICLEWAMGTKKGGAKGTPIEDCISIGQVIDRFRRQVEHLVDRLVEDLHAIERANANFHPTPLTSMLIRGCLQSGGDASAGGALYNASGVQGIGVADVADSLAAMDQVVFDRRLCDLATLVEACRRNFEGYEEIRGHLLKAPKYGNDDPAVDRHAALVLRIFSDALARYTNSRTGSYLPGYYSVTAHVAFGQSTGALPSGRLAGRPLANGLSPANGQERRGPTASLNSVAALDPKGQARNGMNLNLKLDPTSLSGSTGLDLLSGLVKGYFARGGMQVQMNILDPKVLIEARDDPRSHPWLLVRVSGYSAYFADLSVAMKQETIERTLHDGSGFCT